MEETICAISTALGKGAISIIRCSGKDSISIVNEIFSGADLTKVKGHTINYGFIKKEDEIIDEVLVSVMRAPKTYTAEDMVEINLHGGIAPTNKVLELLLCNGCSLATPGEFTKRRFLNGKIDLIKAEAIGDMINSETEGARKLAINQISGIVSDLIRKLRSQLISILADIEVNIDYPEYDDKPDVTTKKLLSKIFNIESELEKLLKDSENGQIIKTGIDVAIIGKPNVGKSSILNALLEENKAIVTDIPGTTRDIVEGKIYLKGILLNIIDTAGIRETEDVVEQIGVQKSIELSSRADLIIYVMDNSSSDITNDIEYLNTIKEKKVIILVNKSDLASSLSNEYLKKIDFIQGNTINPKGLDKLKEKIINLFNIEALDTKNLTFLSSARQIALIKRALNLIKEIQIQIKNEVSTDLLTIDLRNCYDLLGEVIGETYKDDLIDELFSRFCLGK